MKSSSFTCTLKIFGVMACLFLLPCVHAYKPTAQNEKDYKALLSKSTFYKDTKVKNLKLLAAWLIETLRDDMISDNIAILGLDPRKALTIRKVNGINNLDDFAKDIVIKLSFSKKLNVIDLPDIVISASDFVIGSCNIGKSKEKDPSKPGYLEPDYLKPHYFDLFNYYYTPIIDAIRYDYKRNTFLPRFIDLDVIEQWGSPNFQYINEPDL